MTAGLLRVRPNIDNGTGRWEAVQPFRRGDNTPVVNYNLILYTPHQNNKNNQTSTSNQDSVSSMSSCTTKSFGSKEVHMKAKSKEPEQLEQKQKLFISDLPAELRGQVSRSLVILVSSLWKQGFQHISEHQDPRKSQTHVSCFHPRVKLHESSWRN